MRWDTGIGVDYGLHILHRYREVDTAPEAPRAKRENQTRSFRFSRIIAGMIDRKVGPFVVYPGEERFPLHERVEALGLEAALGTPRPITRGRG